jgi:hypothetical protein
VSQLVIVCRDSILVGIEGRLRIAAVRALWGKLPDPREQHLCVKETVA